ncbi:MAG: beta/gamma crystallin domain-containing protein [Amaricoccus sp.]
MLANWQSMGFLVAFVSVGLPCLGQESEVGTSGGPDTPPETCIYFEHADFQGDSHSISYGTLRKYVGDKWNDRISSIACPVNCGLVVWEHRDFQGASKTFAKGYNTQYVGTEWNDRISSMRMVCESETARDCSNGSDTRQSGFVWREARDGDHVCVTPEIRKQTRDENAQAGSRRAGDGAYGPNTCASGFVWREAFPGDVVCVSPRSREQAAADNRRASVRRACTP